MDLPNQAPRRDHPDVALAVVIPVYRIRHLPETLDSLAAQTDQRFRLYIGDDASPDPIAACVSRYISQLDIDYFRFDHNIGADDLVAHWHRCIDRTNGEPWIWLFSDDDVAEPKCVEGFFKEMSREEVDLYRFGLDIINDQSAHHVRPNNHPARENSVDFLKAILSDRSRAWRAQDHIFSRRIYERCGGFISFPNAIYSDYATWLKFSTERGIRTIPGPRVRWRSHPLGTSTGRRERYRERWVLALCMFMRWLRIYAEQIGASDFFNLYALDFFYRDLMFHGRAAANQRQDAIKLAREVLGSTRTNATIRLYVAIFRFRFKHSRIMRRIRRVRTKLWDIMKFDGFAQII